ncbi:helicase associated domain-containing protein [Arthrobacter monumenti]
MDRRWDQALVSAVEFQSAHGRLPRRHSGDPAEEKTAMWLYHARRLDSRGELSAERIQQLDNSLQNWRTPGRTRNEDEKWDARMAELQAFTAANGRVPKRSDKAGEAEWSLALFINRQRSRARNGTLRTDRAAQLEKAVPGWNDRREPSRIRYEREYRSAAWGRVAPHAPVILAGLASGRSPAEMARMTGVPQQLLFGLGRHNTEWAQQFEEALMEGRNPALEHGTHSAYQHGCRCRQCRNLVAGYRQRSQRR